MQTARTQRWPPDELLRTLLDAELASRDASNARARLRAAGFPVAKTLDEFQVAASSVPRATFDYLASLEWIRARENLVLVGPAGTGKSHLLVALGLAAVEAGVRVRYFAATDLVETLYRGLADNSVGRVIEGLLRADLVIVDELGFAPLDDVGTQLLFRFVAAAYERRSWVSPPTGRSRPGAASCPSTPPRCRCSTGCSTTPRWSSPRARASACARPIERRWSSDEALRPSPGWGLLMATGGDFHMAIDKLPNGLASMRSNSASASIFGPHPPSLMGDVTASSRR